MHLHAPSSLQKACISGGIFSRKVLFWFRLRIPTRFLRHPLFLPQKLSNEGWNPHTHFRNCLGSRRYADLLDSGDGFGSRKVNSPWLSNYSLRIKLHILRGDAYRPATKSIACEVWMFHILQRFISRIDVVVVFFYWDLMGIIVCFSG